MTKSQFRDYWTHRQHLFARRRTLHLITRSGMHCRQLHALHAPFAFETLAKLSRWTAALCRVANQSSQAWRCCQLWSASDTF